MTNTEHFVELKFRLDKLQEEVDTLKPAVIDEVKQAGGKIIVENKIVTVQERKTWEYPADIKNMEINIKSAKKKAESDGTARVSVISAFPVIKQVAE